MGSFNFPSKRDSQHTQWERARMRRADSPLNKSRCTKSASNSWTSTRMVPSTKTISEGELDELLGEIGGACTLDNMVKMFQEKMSGEGNDTDDLIIQAFKAYDAEGKIDVKMFQHALKTWGDKMTKAEMDEIFDEFDIDEDYMSRPRRCSASLLPRRKKRRKNLNLNPLLRPHPQRKRMMARRRKRRRRRPPSKLYKKAIYVYIFTPYDQIICLSNRC